MLDRFINDVTALNAENLNKLVVTPLTTSTASGTSAKVFGSTPDALKAGDQLELTFTNGNSVATPTVTINGVSRSFRIGGSAVSGQTLILSSGAKVRCWWDGTYLQLYGNQSNFPTTSQTVIGGAKMYMSGTTLYISTT